jgi:hypothetical protein
MLEQFLEDHMQKGRRFVAARLQAVLTLLEKLRDDATLDLNHHTTSPGSAGLTSHETYGDRAHDRLNLDPINSNHGRRSSQLQDWGPPLLSILRNNGFESASPNERNQLIDAAQSEVGGILRAILDEEPLEARVRNKSAEAVIRDVLRQAEDKGKAGEVAQYLVGAKLILRLGKQIKIHPANKGDRKSRGDVGARAGDFVIEDCIIEVAMGTPDEKHMSQIINALESSNKEVWILTRADRVIGWRTEVEALEGNDKQRVVVAPVDGFVGQNVTELGGFSHAQRNEQLRTLIEIYNEQCVAAVGAKGISITIS